MRAIRLEPKVFPSETGTLRVWDLPWKAVREFDIGGVPYRATRGKHAHRTCDQIIRCVCGAPKLNGAFVLTTFDGPIGTDWTMYSGDAVLVPRMHWIELSHFSPDAVATVLCSEPYTPPITDFDEFLKEVAK